MIFKDLKFKHKKCFTQINPFKKLGSAHSSVVANVPIHSIEAHKFQKRVGRKVFFPVDKTKGWAKM